MFCKSRIDFTLKHSVEFRNCTMKGGRKLDRSSKTIWREEMEASFDKAHAVFLANFTGMTVEELSSLRRGLRAQQAEFKVVKNTIAKKAINGRSQQVVSELLKGQVGVIFAYGDIASTAKVVSEEQKKCEKLKIIGGALGAEKLDAKGINMLASLPSREVLISRIIGSLVAPHRSLLGVLQGVPRTFVSVLNQIKEKKEAS